METRGLNYPVDIEHPKLLDLLRFWEEKRGTRTMPRRSEIDVLELAPWLGNLILLEVLDYGENFLYRVYGTNLVRLIQYDRTGKSTDDLKSYARQAVLAEYRSVAESGNPLYIRQRRTVVKGQLMLSKLVLPLSEDGQSVNRLLAGVYPSEKGMDDALPDRFGGFIGADSDGATTAVSA